MSTNMIRDHDDISRQIDFALDKIFSVTDLLESMNYVGILNRLLRSGEVDAAHDQRAYIFVERSWTWINSLVEEAEKRHGINNYNDLPSNLAMSITQIVGTWQSLLRYHPRGDMVHRACVDIINKSNPTTLRRFVWFLDKVNTHGEEFIDPNVIKMAKEQLSKR